MTAPTAGLVVRDLTVDLGSIRAVEDVALTVLPGQVVGLVGPNGAGKSTVVRAVAGVLRPTLGHVTIDGARAGADPRQLAWVPQDTRPDPLFPALVGEVVWMGRYPHLGAFRRRRPADAGAVAEALDRTGLGGLVDREVSALSGGQQRRVAIARALAQQAPYVVLDEPYAGLDGPTERDLRTVVTDLAREGVGVLLVNHDLSAVSQDCHQVVLLRRTVQAAGPPDLVLQPPTIAAAYGLADDGLSDDGRQELR